MSRLDAVFFDLDGTLIDTAPDFFTVLNALLRRHQRDTVSYAAVRETVSNGARALVEMGFGLTPEDDQFADILEQLLDAYSQHLAVDTRLFPGMADTLAWCAQQGVSWGIVTNKPERFTLPVLAGLSLSKDIGPVICPDHVSQRKPDPEGLLLAAQHVGAKPTQCVYVGDHIRDIEAGRRAGMITVACSFGYVPQHEDPRSWQADHLIDDGRALLPLLQQLHTGSES